MMKAFGYAGIVKRGIIDDLPKVKFNETNFVPKIEEQFVFEFRKETAVSGTHPAALFSHCISNAKLIKNLLINDVTSFMTQDLKSSQFFFFLRRLVHTRSIGN